MDQLAVSLIIILLPGILAAVICDKITRHSKWGSFKFSVYAILLGWLSYLLLQIIVLLTPDHLDSTTSFALSWDKDVLHIWGVLFDVKNTGSEDIYKEVAYAAFASIFVAYISAAFVNYKILNKIAQKIKVSTKYGDENLFSFYLNLDEIRWIYIRNKEKNLTYKGKIIMHSETNNIQEIVLSDVDVYRYEDSAFLYSIDNCYLCLNVGEFTIEQAKDISID